ncbi:galactokinase [Ruminococcaceae bacterium OttesenSCG-928-A16]|nr:galactokinase [Ruminococcaceae bacterium OttesenSCG-928-A16]
MPVSAQVKKDIEAGLYDESFEELYGAGPVVVHKQRQRYTQAVTQFEETYGGEREIAIYSTPGRTEIGGNHTDHNHGVVMAAAVNLDIIAVVSKNNDNFARVQSKGFGAPDIVDLAYLEPVNLEYGKSSALVRGVAAAIKQRGGMVAGFDAYTTSDVLRGSGLSSSAAFEVCMATILNGEYNQNKFTAVELGMIGQFAENKFFGKPSGLMDQTACAVGNAITIDFKDPEHPQVTEIPFDLAAHGYRLVITDTKGSHAGLTDEYTAIRREMESVAEFFGKEYLRQITLEQLLANISAIRAQQGDRAVLRSIHFFEECRRVGVLAGAIGKNDFETFKAAIIESGHSSFEYNQNAYSVRRPEEQGVALGLAVSQLLLAGKGAWRLQGGGFAGTIQAFVPNDLLETYCNELQTIFGSDACYVLNVRGRGTTQVTPL